MAPSALVLTEFVPTVCTLPPEYCEFGGTAKKCEDWLKEKHPDLWEGLYSEGRVPLGN